MRNVLVKKHALSTFIVNLLSFTSISRKSQLKSWTGVYSQKLSHVIFSTQLSAFKFMSCLMSWLKALRLFEYYEIPKRDSKFGYSTKQERYCILALITIVYSSWSTLQKWGYEYCWRYFGEQSSANICEFDMTRQMNWRQPKVIWIKNDFYISPIK